MNVSVVYATPEKQILLEVELSVGATVLDAIKASGILEIEILSLNHVGIFGKVVTLDTVLSPGDRVEIYRSLVMDPKEARRARNKT